MSVTTSQEIGNALEEAVRLIEQTILQTTAKDALVTIEPKKTIIVKDVKHEIDLYVTVDNGRGYIDTNEIRVRLNNEELSYQVFSQRIHDIIKNDVMNHEPTCRFSEGIYPYDVTRTFTYQPGELFIDEFECRELEAHVTWEAQ